MAQEDVGVEATGPTRVRVLGQYLPACSLLLWGHYPPALNSSLGRCEANK